MILHFFGKGFSASNPYTSFGTFPFELDEIIIIFLGLPLLFNTVVLLYGLHIWKQWDPAFFVRSHTKNIVYCSKVWHCTAVILQDHLVLQPSGTDSRISITLVSSEYIE